MRRRRERRTFLTEVRLTETEASERRHSSRFWRESLPGRLLGWVPGVSVEPKGDVKKARRAAAGVAQRLPAPGCSNLRRWWAAECRAGRLSASAAAFCCARSLALHDCITFWLLAHSPRRQHDGCLPSCHASPHVSVGHGPKVPAETCGSRPAWRERRLGAPAQELRHHDAAGAVEALVDSAGDSPFRERVVAHGAAFGDAADSRRARRSRRGARRAGHADVLFHRRRPLRGDRYGCLTSWQNMVVLKDPSRKRLAQLTKHVSDMLSAYASAAARQVRAGQGRRGDLARGPAALRAAGRALAAAVQPVRRRASHRALVPVHQLRDAQGARPTLLCCPAAA